jgi:hypothetical protein
MPCLGSFGDMIDEEAQIALCETRMTRRYPDGYARTHQPHRTTGGVFR